MRSGHQAPEPRDEEPEPPLPPGGGTLSVEVVACSDLLSADASGKSDPYITLRLNANAGDDSSSPAAKTQTQPGTQADSSRSREALNCRLSQARSTRSSRRASSSL